MINSASKPSLPVLNVAAYRFVPIDDAHLLRERIESEARALALLGRPTAAALDRGAVCRVPESPGAAPG